MKHSWSLFRGQWAENLALRGAITHAPAKQRDRMQATGQHLALVDDRAYIQAGYNPYDTVVHVKDTRTRDVWRSKPKRA